MVPARVVAIRERAHIGWVDVDKIKPAWVDLEHIPAKRDVPLAIRKNRLIEQSRRLTKLSAKREPQVLSRVPSLPSDEGEDSARALLYAGSTCCREGQ